MAQRKGPDAVGEALIFATRAHGGQLRKDGRTPYVVHPVSVLRHLSSDLGVQDRELLIAALLHDLLEDTPTTPAQIERDFGPRVLGLVRELTIPPQFHGPSVPDANKTRRILEDAARMSPEALLIKLCDRWDNLGDMANTSWSPAKRRNYRAQTRKLLALVEGRLRRGELGPRRAPPTRRAVAAIRSMVGAARSPRAAETLRR
ncbi:MAG TPA: HD domain-containing protein [Thermoplasmata archaeon]|nr:HD domain-containing protein [Thermoplasmata archaeon]